MIVLSHRGYWKHKYEQNQAIAFERSFSLGFGVETDIRDYNGGLVVSHDIADNDSMSLECFFEIYNKYGINLPLALNIKSDGLQTKLKNLIDEYNIINYFVFDMSVPDTFSYLDSDMIVFARQSEYEPMPELFGDIHGVWLDQLKTEWYSGKLIEKTLNKCGVVCIVSPDLHGRDYTNCWSLIDTITERNKKKLMICTDYPSQAEVYFNGK